MNVRHPSELNLPRRRDMLAGVAATAAAAMTNVSMAKPNEQPAPASQPLPTQPVKAFCIDFNWSDGRAADPGHYAQAEPQQHVDWYRELGCNTIQTFCVSYNGYAWYPSDVAPITPGLKHPNFLGDMVTLGHKAGMKVMGYFNLGANPYWEAQNPNLVHQPQHTDYIRIPFTLEYLDYFCRSIEDTLEKVDIDGFMIDWVRPTQHNHWLDCEKEAWRQVMGEAFPQTNPSAQAVLHFDRAMIARAWRYIQWAVKATRPVTVWTNHPFVEAEKPLWEDHVLLKQVDWVLNEDPDAHWLDWLKQRTGPHTLIIQNLCGWWNHDAEMWRKIDPQTFGFYGFAQADAKTTLPTEASPSNIRNIEILREAYRKL